MYHVDIGIVYQIAEIVVRLHVLLQVLLRLFNGVVKMVLVNIAHRGKATMLVTCEMAARTPHSAYADDTFGELVARGNVPVAAKHPARDNGKQTYPTHGFKKSPSACFHYTD